MRQRFKPFRIPGRDNRGDSSLGLNLIEDGREPIVDIVAIHGLNGHSEKTWTAGNDVNWLRKFLPIDVPNARIFSYGYEAKTHAASPVSQLTFPHHAEELVGELCRKRKNAKETERPIIFIAHSLGGIVVKSALVYSENCSKQAPNRKKKRLGSIVEKTHGIFFMGTPHQGGNGVEMAQVILTVAGVFMQTNPMLLKSLGPGSKELQELNREYFDVANKRQFDTILCYEDRKTVPLWNGPKVWVVPRSSATMPLPNSNSMVINADHRGMVRYPDREDKNYQKVKECLRSMVDSIAEDHHTDQVASQGWSVKFDKRRLPMGQCFVGRKKELEQIHQKLQVKGDQSIVILHGLGGVGKTQLAAQYAIAHRTDYDAVFWLYSKDIGMLEQSFVDAAQRISAEHPEYFPRFLRLVREYDRDRSKEQDVEEAIGEVVEIREAAVEEVKSFLSHEDNTNWLLIFDNYNTPNVGAHGKNHAAFSIASFFPSAYHGHIIVTSTSSKHAIGQLIPVKKLQDDEESLLILSHNSGRPNLEEDSGAKELAKKLDGLPLALTSTGAYLRQTGMSFAKYLELYNEAWSKMQEHSPQLENYNGTLWTTWKLALDQVEETNPNSKELFLLWGYFDNQDIWWEMIKAGRDGAQQEWFRKITEHELEFEYAMRSLCEYNLAEPNPASPPQNGGSHGYSMHACVHDWTKYGLNKDKTIVNEEKESEMAKLAFSCLAKLMPRRTVSNFWILQQRLTKHVDQCQQIIRRLPSKNDDASMAYSLHQIGVFYYGENKLDLAEELFQRALEAWKSLLGIDHLETLKAMNNLACTYIWKGDLDKAKEMLDRVLAGKKKVLGDDDEYTLKTYLFLGSVYRGKKNPIEEGKMLRHALEGLERIDKTPKKKFTTWNAAFRLALFHQRQHEPAQAALLFDRAWRGLSSSLGTNHPSALSCVKELGDVYTELREFDKAEESYRLALKGSEQSRDLKETSTMAREIWRAKTIMYQQWGKPNEEERSCRQALEWFEKVFGPDHPSTLAASMDLGLFLRMQGLRPGAEWHYQDRKLTEASEMYLMAREGYERTLGPDHISTQDAIFMLGRLLSLQGNQVIKERQYRVRKLTEALEMYEMALEGYRRTCGRDGAFTLQVLRNVGDLCMLLDGMLGKAEESFKEALEGYERTRGRDSESALQTLGRLGETYMLKRELNKAQKLFEEALEGFEHKFGKDHRTTRWIAVRLWDVHSQQGNLEAAKSYADRFPRLEQPLILTGFGENGTPSPPPLKLLCDKPWRDMLRNDRQ